MVTRDGVIVNGYI